MRKTRPLDAVTLRDLALSYVARFATTGAKLEAYLARKVRERGVAEDADGRMEELDIAGLVADFAARGYIDDEAYARAKSRDLTQRGYGKRRVEQALWAAGVEEDTRADAAPSEAQAREAAVVMAKKRRFGPFARPDASLLPGDEEPHDQDAQRKLSEKQIAAMLRAGHHYDHVRFILDAPQVSALEEWIEEAREDEAKEGFWDNGD
ncbi:MAG: RecX family transcriptional regulator [Pseudomonadota bacterium]